MSKPVTREAPALADASGYMAAVLVASALLATGFWVQHRAGPVHDPSHFYNDLYAALVVVRHDPTITELRVPYQMREIARLETGKRIDVGGEVSHAGVARLTFRPREAPLQKRYARYLTSDEAAQTDGLWKYHRIWDSPSQQVSLERLEPQLALECPGPTELSQRSHDR